MDAETRLTMQQANRILKLNDHEDVSEDPVRHALHEWQKASTEWTAQYRRMHSKTDSTGSEHDKKLRRLEKRLNKAADNYEKEKSKDDWFISRGRIS